MPASRSASWSTAGSRRAAEKRDPGLGEPELLEHFRERAFAELARQRDESDQATVPDVGHQRPLLDCRGVDRRERLRIELGADPDRAGGEVAAEPSPVREHRLDVGWRVQLEHLQECPAGALRVEPGAVAQQRRDRGGGCGGIEPRTRIRALAAIGEGGNDADDVLSEANRHHLGDGGGEGGWTVGDECRRVIPDRQQRLCRAGAWGPLHRGAERRKRDCDWAAERVGRRAGDALEVIAGDGGGRRSSTGWFGGQRRPPPELHRRSRLTQMSEQPAPRRLGSLTPMSDAMLHAGVGAPATLGPHRGTRATGCPMDTPRVRVRRHRRSPCSPRSSSAV